MNFEPSKLEFEPGEKIKKFTYKTDVGAVSGLIEVELEPAFKDLYYTPNPVINFEIQDFDTEPPKIETFKMTELKGTSMKMRTSVSESSRVYYLASFKGT